MGQQEDAQQLQQLQQQLQNVVMQKETLKVQKQEAKNALNELETNVDADTDVFKSVGTLLISKDVDTLKQELEDDVESTEVQIASLDKMQTKLEKKLQSAQERLTQNPNLSATAT